MKPGTAIEVHDKSKKMLRIQEALETVDRRGVPQWLEIDKKALKGTVKSVPEPRRPDDADPGAADRRALLEVI